MYKEHKATVGEDHAANPYGGHNFPADSTATSDPVARLRRLDWIGPHAFKARYGTQPGVAADFGMWWGPRHDQRICHRRASLDSPNGLLYAYDLTWDEYAVLAIDVPSAAIEAVIHRALASDTRMSAEVIAGLLADHQTVPTPDGQTATGLATGVER